LVKTGLTLGYPHKSTPPSSSRQQRIVIGRDPLIERPQRENQVVQVHPATLQDQQQAPDGSP